MNHMVVLLFPIILLIEVNVNMMLMNYYYYQHHYHHHHHLMILLLMSIAIVGDLQPFKNVRSFTFPSLLLNNDKGIR